MRRELADAVSTLGLDERDEALIGRNAAIIVELLPALVKDFYAHQVALDRTGLFHRSDLSRLEALQAARWKRLFTGDRGDAYVAAVTRIGVVHRERGITPKLYMQSYGWFASRLMAEIVAHRDLVEADRAPLAAAVLRVIFLDMSLALASYEAALLD